MRIGIRVAGSKPLKDIAGYARSLEELGYDYAGIVDSQLVCRDALLTSQAVLSATHRIHVGTAVTNPFTRHSSVLANCAMTLHELAAGRFELVMGSGYSAARMIGRRAATIEDMRREVATIRRLLQGGDVEYGDTEAHLPFGDRCGPPIWLAATGPRALELAGELADGVLVAVGLHPQMLERALEHVQAGADRASRQMSDLKIRICARTIVDQDPEEALRRARPLCAQWITERSRSPWLETLDVAIDMGTARRSIDSIYPDLIHAEDPEKAIRATSFLSDDDVERIGSALGIIGTPDHCRRKVRDMSREGIDDLYLMPMSSYGTPDQEVATFAKPALEHGQGADSPSGTMPGPRAPED